MKVIFWYKGYFFCIWLVFLLRSPFWLLSYEQGSPPLVPSVLERLFLSCVTYFNLSEDKMCCCCPIQWCCWLVATLEMYCINTIPNMVTCCAISTFVPSFSPPRGKMATEGRDGLFKWLAWSAVTHSTGCILPRQGADGVRSEIIAKGNNIRSALKHPSGCDKPHYKNL